MMLGIPSSDEADLGLAFASAMPTSDASFTHHANPPEEPPLHLPAHGRPRGAAAGFDLRFATEVVRGRGRGDDDGS